ncbi:hypothetical protein [Neptuniibacter marinus]|uniref:hypothetical protein n=1 Tax=Neptuniibacter marinus TaxID=1806670 RepID=UPI00082F39FB|nr:hypothetical protein [Neptuniibacter marinus]
MDTEQSDYTWDKAFFEKRSTLFSNFQMGFIGAALMLMMMDLSKIYLLAPLVVGLILSSWYKHNLDNIKDEMKGCTLTFSPKSIFISFPQLETESRITFREIDEVEAHKENFVHIISLYLKQDDKKVQLKGMKDTEQLIQQLKTAIKTVNEQQE